MKFSALAFLLASSTNALVLPRATPSATLVPYLAPLCEVTGLATGILCDFPQQTLSEGQCVDVTYQCPVHYPASFQAYLDGATDGTTCHVTVFSASGCAGDEVESGSLSASSAGEVCNESPFFGKALNGGELGSQLLPFGFMSSRLDCS